MVKRSLQQRLVQARGPAHHPRLGVSVFLEQQRGQHRHQRERQQQRDAQGEHDGQRHRHKQFAFQPLQREQGHEGQTDDEDARGHRHGDLARRGEYAVQARLVRTGRVRVEPTDGVFHHHYGSVHQHADGDREATQAHQVGAHADKAHQQEGTQRRQRHHHRHHQRGAKLAEEQKQQDDDQYRRFQQGAFHRAHGALDQRAAVIERHHLDAGRQAGSHLVQPGADGLHERRSIGPAQRHHDAFHRFARAVPGDGAIASHAFDAHLGHVAQANWGRAIGPRAQDQTG